MPTVHPQVQKARDLMPLVAAAADENDDIRELTKPVVKALVDGGKVKATLPTTLDSEHLKKLGQRFRSSNHIMRPCRACRSMCERPDRC